MTRRFDDPTAGWAYDRGTDPTRLLVLFGSRLGGVVAGETPWGFVRSSDGTSAARLFLRDHRRGWYAAGVRGLDSEEKLCRAIELAADGRDRAVLFGASMGGYGALLYGRLLGLDVVAINPQTTIDPEQLAALGDDRWPDDVAAIAATRRDVAPLVDRPGHVRIIYATGQPLDVAHAERLRGWAGLALDPRASTAHDLARHLAATGELRELLS